MRLVNVRATRTTTFKAQVIVFRATDAKTCLLYMYWCDYMHCTSTITPAHVFKCLLHFVENFNYL